MNKIPLPGPLRKAAGLARENPLGFWPPVFSLAVFLLLYVVFRFSPYGALESFLIRPWSTRYYDRRGNLVQILPLEDGLRREYAGPGDIGPGAAAVFLTAEDERFYYHPGIDPLSALRALFQNIREHRRVSGASTITMQLARIIASHPREGPRGLAAKIAETLNAIRLETRFSKDEILNLYLNSLPFGFQTEGLASAARNFFSTEISLLTPAELFCLAVIPRRPAAYNPFTGRDACIEAGRRLALRFAESPWAGKLPPYVPVEEAWGAVNPRRFQYPQHMPHLVRHVNAMLTASPEGKHTVPPPDYFLSADLELQRAAEDLIRVHIRRQTRSRLTNGAALVIDNRTGEVLAWVGSADYYSRETSGQIDGVLAENQMGSSMKPFLYALALERGFKPSDVLADIPSKYGSQEVYIPQNFNNRFNGPVLFRTALASSLNIPAVDLLHRLGVEEFARFLAALGFTLDSQAAETAGLGLVLGNAPVKLAELAAGFSVFPRDGVFLPLRFERGGGGEGKQVMKSDTARLICSILSDRRARVLGFGRGTNFETPFPAMFKTGTANQYQNIVALGATPRFTAAVWMGNFTGETVQGRTGSSLPAAVVRRLLLYLQGDRGEPFLEPRDWIKAPVCALSGMTPTAACPSVLEEYRPRGWIGESCHWHVSRGSSVVVEYPPEYQGWFFSQAREGAIRYSASPLEILNPRNNYTFFSSAGTGAQRIPVEVIGGLDDTITVDHNGETFTVSRPFVFFLPHRPGRHSLRVTNRDETAEVYFTAE